MRSLVSLAAVVVVLAVARLALAQPQPAPPAPSPPFVAIFLDAHNHVPSIFQYISIFLLSRPLESFSPTFPSFLFRSFSFLYSSFKAECLRHFRKSLRNNESYICDHHTILFDPPSLQPWSPYFGKKETLKILALGHDEHAQAILVDAIGPPRLLFQTYLSYIHHFLCRTRLFDQSIPSHHRRRSGRRSLLCRLLQRPLGSLRLGFSSSTHSRFAFL